MIHERVQQALPMSHIWESLDSFDRDRAPANGAREPGSGLMTRLIMACVPLPRFRGSLSSSRTPTLPMASTRSSDCHETWQLRRHHPHRVSVGSWWLV